jgi:hypothetical protein
MNRIVCTFCTFSNFVSQIHYVYHSCQNRVCLAYQKTATPLGSRSNSRASQACLFFACCLWFPVNLVDLYSPINAVCVFIFLPHSCNSKSNLFRIEECIQNSLFKIDSIVGREVFDWLSHFSGWSDNYYTQFIDNCTLWYVTSATTKKARFKILPEVLHMMAPWGNQYRKFADQIESIGTPGRIRTCGLRIRSPALYPAELRAQKNGVSDGT